MKQLYYGLLLLVLAVPFRLRAQVSDPTRATLNNLFYPLDKSQVPTGRLAEYATQLVPLDVFNGVLTDSSRTSPDGFRYIYATLASAQVSGTALPTLADLNSRTATAQAQAGNAIPLLAARVDYAVVRPDAFSANLLRYQNGQVSDVPGRSQSPYLTRTAFAVAPTRASSPNGIVSFVLASTLYTQSGGGGVSARYIDFGNGNGYQAAYWDQAIGGIYASAGTYRVKVRFVYNDGSTLESHFDLTVGQAAYSQDPNPEYRPGQRPLPGTDQATAARGVLYLTNYDGVVTATSTRAAGKAYVTRAPGHTSITKPFIVAEGYDPSKTLSFLENYSDDTFIGAIGTPTNPFNFYNQLRNAGYDIIYLDYDDGTEDIVKLAELFKEVVNRVNAAKVSLEQNVVLGISMGGLVARYGLADMEKASAGSTQTRLLILQDSPQRGANTPLGIQALVRQANINFGSFTLFDANKYLAQLNGLLDRPASQQLLLYRATDASSGIAYNTFLANVYRPKITFPAGQNPPYQIIAASNGSQCGKALFAPYTELARADASIFASPLPWIIRTRYYAQIIVNAIPANGQANRLSTLQFYAIIRLFGFINLRVNFVREDYNCPTGLLAVDGVAGGTQYIGARAQQYGLPGGFNFSIYTPFFGASFGYSLQREFCFVPTASALDAADFTQAALAGTYVRGIASVSPSRTDGFLAQAPFYENGSQYSNQFHTVFDDRNSSWLFSRMQNTTQPASYCYAECSPPVNSTITGPLTLCVGTGGPATYTSPLQGPGYTYAWSFDDCSLVTVCGGTNPTLQTANVGIDGTTTLTLTVTTPCTTYTFTKEVTVGKPAEPLVVLEEQDDCYHIAYLHIENYDPTLTYSHKGTGSITGGRFFVKVDNFSVTATSSNCGATTYSGTISWNPCRTADPAASTSAEPAYSVYPNPASDQVTISLSEEAGRRAAGLADFTVRLYDTYGKLRYSAHSSSAQVQFATSELPVGLYVLTITEAGSGTETRRQLQVKR